VPRLRIARAADPNRWRTATKSPKKANKTHFIDFFDFLVDNHPVQGTDEAILTTLGERLSRQRLARDLTQATLATEAGVSKRTVERMEAGQSVQLNNALRVLRALDLLGGLDRLVPEVPASPMAALKAEQKRRKRASGDANAVREKTPGAGGDAWTWGDDA